MSSMKGASFISEAAEPTGFEEGKRSTDYVERAHETQVAEEDDFHLTFGKAIAIMSLILPASMAVMYLSATSSLLPVINADLGPNTSYTWVVGAFAVAASSMSPLCGRLSDIFGRRYFLLAGAVFGAVGAIIAATSKSINTSIGAGALSGISLALLQLVFGASAELVPKRSRGIVLGFVESFLGLISGFAPVIGFSLAAKNSWRDLYWIIFAVDVISIIAIFFFYHPMNQYIHEEGKTQLGQFLSLDWIGTFLFTCGLTLFLLGLSFGGGTFPWKSAGAIAPLVVGFALLVLCGFWEAYATLAYPIFPPIIFKNTRGFTIVVFTTFIVGILYYACLVLWPQQVAYLYTTNSIAVGWYAGVFGFAGFISAGIIGFLLKRTGGLQWWLRGVVALVLLVSGLQAIASPTSNVGSSVLVAICGVCVALGNVISTVIVQVSVPHEYLGVATLIIATARSVGGAVATTVYVVILQSQIPKYIVKDVALPLAEAGVAPASIPAVLGALLDGVDESILGTLTLAQLGVAASGVKWAFAHSFRIVYLSSIAFGAIGLVASMFVANVDKLLTNKVEIQLEEGAHLHSHTDTGEGHIIKHVEGVHED